MTTHEEIRQQINATSVFKPFAYFDKHMDCIRVQIADVSVTEVRMSKFITLLRQNHRTSFGAEHVGFTIKGVAHVFHEVGLLVSGVHDLSAIIDAVVKVAPHAAVQKIVDDFSPLLRDRDMKVSFDEEPEERLAA